MRQRLPLLLLALAAAALVALLAGGVLRIGGGSRDADGVAPDAAPTALDPAATDLAAGARREALPDTDPAAFEGDPVGVADARLGTASLVGRVVADKTAEPIRFARVLLPLDPPASVAVRTRKDGTFEVRGLPSGVFDLRVAALDFDPRTFETPALSPDARADAGDLPLRRHVTLTHGLAVKVVDEAGRPIPGARVAASTLPWGILVTIGAMSGIPDPVTREATTDDVGTARLAPLPPERYDVVARAPGFALNGVTSVVVAAGRIESVTIALGRALTIEGTVVDADGAGVGGAFVSGLSVPSFRSYDVVTSDPLGQFTLEGLAPGNYMVFAGQDEKGEGMTPNVKAGDRGTKIRLGGAGRVKGRVLEADGTPATRFTLRPYTGDWFRYNYSRVVPVADDEGRFSLALAPGAYSIDVRSETGAFTTTTAVTVTQGSEATLDVRLPAAGVVLGVVTDAEGHHLPGAEVFVKRGGFPPEPVREQYVRADAEGRFALRGLGLESVRLHVRHPAWATTELVATASPPGEAREITVRMARGARVLGRVTTKGGQPVEGTQVNLSQGFDFFNAKTTFTGSDGAFAFTAVAKGTYQVSTGRFENAASGLRKQVNVGDGGDVGVDFELAATDGDGAKVVGTVRIAGKPPPRTTVYGEDERGAASAVTTETDATGRYELAGLKPGRVRVWIQTASGLSESKTARITDAGGVAEVNFDFGTCGVRATLVAADGRTPVSGAWVSLEAAEAGGGFDNVRAQVNSDAQGVVSVLGLASGAYRLRVVGSGFAAKTTGAFAVADGEVKDLGTVRLEPGGGVTGRVTDGAGVPVEGVGVSLTDPQGQSVFLFNIASTGSNGRYEVQGVAFGRYRVRFEGKGFAPVEREVEVNASGGVADAVMRRGGAITVRVEDETGAPVGGARVVLLDAAGRRVERTLSIVNLFSADVTRTGDAGTTTVPDLAPGVYRVTAEAPGYEPAADPASTTVAVEGRADLTVVMRPATGR